MSHLQIQRLNQFDALQRQQYRQLLQLERMELLQQQQTSFAWLQYIYIVLHFTKEYCQSQNHDFSKMSLSSQQNIALHVANALRSKCHLPKYHLIYHPLDAEVVVKYVQLKYPHLLQTSQHRMFTYVEIVKLIQKHFGNWLESASSNDEDASTDEDLESAIDSKGPSVNVSILSILVIA